MKKVLLPVLLFVSVSSLLLLYQWGSYDQPGENVSADQSVEAIKVDIKVKRDQFIVEYTFNEWESGTYLVLPPNDQVKVLCSPDCDIKKRKNGYKWANDSSKPMTLTYQLPYKEGTQAFSWTLEFMRNNEKMNPSYQVSLEDYVNQEYTWIGLTTKNSDIKKDFVRYYQFQPTSHPNFPLLLLTNPTKGVWDAGKWMVTYSKENELKDETKRRILELTSEYAPALIELDQSESESGEGVVSIKGRDMSQLERVVFLKQLKGQYPETDQDWVFDTLEKVFFSSGDQSTKSGVMALDIQATLSDEQLNVLKEKLLQQSNEGTLIKRADNLLSEVYGKTTSYFSLNNGKSPVIPLYYRYDKGLMWSDDSFKGSMILVRGEEYLPFEAMVKRANYRLTKFESDKLFRVEVPGRTYRFYLNRSTFILNEQEFGVANDLLRMIDGKLYMKKEYVEDLLDIAVYEQENQIMLQKKIGLPN
ncbi:hypothetical protein H0266_05150 [Halobacillus locisalis]|uniref:Copper amine oxidase N-terminal domain-containing protein n=1 Tax=Halobacillus locisalis TaxID=220753 RepID=A0A838CQX9_9BACI|nr:hypothetical protein [Halobacillus locisalis]MBA2174288.1 hypothetical protein [Halobacillus locisalis]